MLDLTSAYISAGGNRHSAAASWSFAHNTLAFGAGCTVALWRPNSQAQEGIEKCLTGHLEPVTAVKFLTPSCLPTVLISGSSDQTIRIWSFDNPSSRSCIMTLGDLGSTINCIAVQECSDVFASGSANGEIMIWEISVDEHKNPRISMKQKIVLSPKILPLAIELQSVASGHLLFVVGTSNTIYVYSSVNGNDFCFQTGLYGHEGWVRAITVARDPDSSTGDLLIASASQDKYIRIWRLATVAIETSQRNSISPQKSLSNKQHPVTIGSQRFSITFEALLLGHDDWIYTAVWTETGGKLALLSSSADNSLAIWSFDTSSRIWTCSSRLGQISSEKGSTTATGSTGGFYIGLWSADSKTILSLSRAGSWRRWCYDSSLDMWIQLPGISGHTKSITGIAWAKDGGYLLSTASDQTTRLHGERNLGGISTWHELARAQIHGHDLNCIDTIDNTRFVSGAEEKLLRVFGAPRAAANLIYALSGHSIGVESTHITTTTVPVLGLSNKAIITTNSSTEGTESPKPFMNDNKTAVEKIPIEDDLSRHTLWPELEKLYGHGCEVAAVASSLDGRVIASSCKASSAEHATIRLHTTNDWREIVPPLSAHSLTVTALAFSSNDKYLLSVGRDRQWTLFERRSDENGNLVYALVDKNPKGHSRMILDVCWACNHEPSLETFITAGRDSILKIWTVEEGKVACVLVHKSLSPITAVHSTMMKDILLVCFGEETGGFGILKVDRFNWTILSEERPPANENSSKGISSIKWRPGAKHDHSRQVAIADGDGVLQILKLSI